MSAEHGLLVVSVGGSQGIALCQCVCGWIGSPVSDAKWTYTLNGDGTASIRPSIDFKEHFHETFDRATVGHPDFDLRDARFPDYYGGGSVAERRLECGSRSRPRPHAR